MTRGMSTNSLQTHLKIMHDQQTCEEEASKLPQVDCTGMDILDIGCGIGQHLLAQQFVKARSRHGIDTDIEAIQYASQVFPQLTLQCARAEAIPYPSASFDLVYSSVSICYTRIPKALAEMYRVTRPNGTVWMSLHGVRMEREFVLQDIRRLKVKGLIHRVYVWCNAVYFTLTGDTFYRPGSKVMESFQFKGAMQRALKRAGFVDIEFGRDRYKMLVQARRP